MVSQSTIATRKQPLDAGTDLGVDFQGWNNRINVVSVPFSRSIVVSLVAAFDSVIVFATGLIVYRLYLGCSAQTYLIYLSVCAVNTFLTVAAFYSAGLYSSSSVGRLPDQIKKILPICAVIFLVLLAVLFALKISAKFSRVWFFAWFFSTILFICLHRLGANFLLLKWAQAGRLTRNIIIIGGGDQARRLLEYFDRIHEPWNRIIGIYDDRIHRITPIVKQYPVWGTVHDALRFTREHRVDDVIVTLPWTAEKRVFDIVKQFAELPVHVHLGCDLAGLMYSHPVFSLIGGVPMLSVVQKPLTGWRFVLKELEDRVLAVILLILLMPLMFLVALAIKIESKGPVLFRQQRHGFNNKIFLVCKFRTMYHNRSPGKGAPQARRNDERVTRVGWGLRRTSLDELPQLFNVLQGTMSMVGPRPHPLPLNQEYASVIDGYYARHRFKPGITGWAQVNGLRGETDTPDKMCQRVQYDLYYIENWSLWFDLQILAMTPFVGLINKNAY